MSADETIPEEPTELSEPATADVSLVRSVLRVWRPAEAELIRPGMRLLVEGEPFEVDEVRLVRDRVKVYGQPMPIGADASELPEPVRRRSLEFVVREMVPVLASRLSASGVLDDLRNYLKSDSDVVRISTADPARLTFTCGGWLIDCTVDDT